MVRTVHCTEELLGYGDEAWPGDNFTVEGHGTEQVSPPRLPTAHEGVPFHSFLDNHYYKK